MARPWWPCSLALTAGAPAPARPPASARCGRAVDAHVCQHEHMCDGSGGGTASVSALAALPRQPAAGAASAAAGRPPAAPDSQRPPAPAQEPAEPGGHAARAGPLLLRAAPPAARRAALPRLRALGAPPRGLHARLYINVGLGQVYGGVRVGWRCGGPHFHAYEHWARPSAASTRGFTKMQG